MKRRLISILLIAILTFLPLVSLQALAEDTPAATEPAVETEAPTDEKQEEDNPAEPSGETPAIAPEGEEAESIDETEKPSEAEATEEAPAMTGDQQKRQALYDKLWRLFALHQRSHEAITETESIRTGDDMQFLRCKYPSAGRTALIACLDFGYSDVRPVPKDEEEAAALLHATLADAATVEAQSGVSLVDRERMDTLTAEGNLAYHFSGPAQWITGRYNYSDVVLAPFYIADGSGALVDEGNIYFLLMISGINSTQVWICADSDAVYEACKDIAWEEADAAFAQPVLTWLETYEPTLPIGILDGRTGTATVKEDGSINIRAEASFESPIIGKAKPGDLFPTFETQKDPEDNEWIEIRMVDERIGYVPAQSVTVEPFETE